MRTSKISGYRYIHGVIIVGERGTVKFCSICQKQFSMLNKEHQCKRCLRPVCEKCSPSKGIASSDNKMHRQCNLCRDEIERMKRFIEEYRLCFSIDTLGLEWLKQQGVSYEKAKSEYYEEQSRNSSDLSEFNGYKQQIQGVFKEIQTGQNYSLREFYIQCLKQNSKERVFESVENVLDLFLKQYPKVGYSPDLVMITMFLLFFGSVAVVYGLLKILYLRIFPDYLWYRNQRYKGEELKEEIQNIIEVNQRLSKPVSNTFLSQKVQNYITTLTINMLLFETSFHIINSMFMSSAPYQELIKELSLVMSMTNSEILQVEQNVSLGEQLLLRNTYASKLQTMNMKTRSMSITFTKEEAKEVKEPEQMKDSMILSLQLEVNQKEVTTSALLSQIESLKFQLRVSEEKLQQKEQRIGELEKEMDILKEDSKYFKELKENKEMIEEMIKLKDSDQMRKKVESLEQQLQVAQENNHKYYLEVEQLNITLNEIRKMQKRYSISQEDDKILLQDLKDLEDGMDDVKKKLLKGISELITQQKTEINLKEMELQLRRDEVYQTPVIEKLKKEIESLEEELNDANIQIISLQKQAQRVSIQGEIKKKQKQQNQEQQQLIGCGTSANKDSCRIF